MDPTAPMHHSLNVWRKVTSPWTRAEATKVRTSPHFQTAKGNSTIWPISRSRLARTRWWEWCADDTVYATAATLNAGDSLTGGAGTDVLALVGSGTFRVDQLATFTGFERIRLDNATNSFCEPHSRQPTD